MAAPSRTNWFNALATYVRNPELHPETIRMRNKHVTVIVDKYPKAQHHYLILANSLVDHINELDETHIPLLKEMMDAADEIAAEICDKEMEALKLGKKIDKKSPTQFIQGFHATPSMRYLHLHLISTDFNSECMKHKKHWNSFTTEFLVPPQRIIDMLEQKGRVQLDEEHYKGVLRQPLSCYHCRAEFRTMPDLKCHIGQDNCRK